MGSSDNIGLIQKKGGINKYENGQNNAFAVDSNWGQ